MTLQDLSGRNVLITGANTGIGRATASALAQQGAHLWLACRSKERTLPVLNELRSTDAKVEFIELDLADFDSVAQCAATFLANDTPLHLLINNAGVAGAVGETRQGFELTFGVNHLGHFLLTELLLETLKRTPRSRIINVASMAHYKSPPLDLDHVHGSPSRRSILQRYRLSKLCNVLHASHLADRLREHDVTTYSLHPGVVASDVWRHVPPPLGWLIKPFMITNEAGAATTLYCATSEECGRESGLYYDNQRRKEPSAQARDPQLAERLHARSTEWTSSWLNQ